MFRLARPLARFGLPNAQNGWRRWYSSPSAKSPEPLNILFCGSDEFSIYSLRALRELQSKRPEKIASIDVVCRPDKYTGRGMKTISEVPIKSEATKHGLGLHQIDTFKGWQAPASINLVVAVSFGLLVPSRILDGAKYGGLNVHPSLLPDLRGPAPIVHALLKQRKHTGVSLQTMHPTRFDHGVVLDQSPAPGIEIPKDCTPDQLIQTLGPLGAEMLSRGIEDGLFVDPQDLLAGRPSPKHFDHAPKITPEDRHIDWNIWTGEQIHLRDRVLGRLWDMETYSRVYDKPAKRVVFEGPWETDKLEDHLADDEDIEPGEAMVLEGEKSNKDALAFWTCDGCIAIPQGGVTIDGGKKGMGSQGMVEQLLKEH